MLTDQGFHDECGVFGICDHAESSNITYLGLYALQHRGQESAGIVSADSKNLFVHRGMGYVADVFSRMHLDSLPGIHSIGHVRYSTQGGSSIRNAQPVVVSGWRGPIALSHNGNLVNAHSLKKDLERSGSIFQTTNDSEVILHLIARAPEEELEFAIITALRQIKGAYSLLFLTPEKLIAVRDPNGFRPLVKGRLDGSVVFASETCALDLIGAEYIREVAPGEMLVVNDRGVRSIFPFSEQKPTHCIFELIYFSRPDSIVFGKSVYEFRKKLGMYLAMEHPVEADIVIPVPDSGIGAALGYSEQSGIRFETGLIRNHYIGRTFIEPRQSIRDFGVKVKLNPVRHALSGKRIVVIDDSIVRGTTSRKLVRMIRSAGATEIHVRISSPPTIGPCGYGIDTPTSGELVANRMALSEICKYIEADSLGYLSGKGLTDATAPTAEHFCTACFSLKYPIEFSTEFER